MTKLANSRVLRSASTGRSYKVETSAYHRIDLDHGFAKGGDDEVHMRFDIGGETRRSTTICVCIGPQDFGEIIREMANRSPHAAMKAMAEEMLRLVNAQQDHDRQAHEQSVENALAG